MTQVQTTAGPVQGEQQAQALTFKGMPFAASPAGPNRFLPPQPLAPWTDVRDCTKYGPAAPQHVDENAVEMWGSFSFPQEEDGCLNLNVWTPAADGGARAVMVWFHGGGFMTGTGAEPVFDGTRLSSRQDVVVVTVNYRLGALGFLHLGKALGQKHATTGNLGLLDQMAALAWVRDNIAGFGGDPANVTVFGQSAGAMSVAALMASPLARGLFHKAILQSGSGEYVFDETKAALIGEEVLRQLGASTLEELQALPVEAFVAVTQGIMAFLREQGDPLGIPFAPVIDGEVLTTGPLEAIASGSARDVKVLLGSAREEARLWLLSPDVLPFDDENLIAMLASMSYADPDQALHAFRENEPVPGDTSVGTGMLAEFLFGAPGRRVAAAQAAVGECWTYLFSWRSTARGGDLGACHSMELPFVFDNLAVPGVTNFTGDAPSQDLADEMSSRWGAFARTGDPGTDWPRYDTVRHATMVFDTESRVEDDPMRAYRTLSPAT